MLGTKQQRFEVLLEEIKHEVHVTHEQVSDLMGLKPRVYKLSEDMADVKMKVDLIIGSLKEKAPVSRVNEIDARLRVVEQKHSVVA